MKPNLLKQYPFTGDYYSYVIETTAGEQAQITERVYTTTPTEVKMALSVNLLGELLIDSQSKMQLNGLLKNIRDINGEEIYQAGEWEIIQTSPILSTIGTKEGYQYRADLIAGEI